MMIHRKLLPFCAVRKPSCKITSAEACEVAEPAKAWGDVTICYVQHRIQSRSSIRSISGPEFSEFLPKLGLFVYCRQDLRQRHDVVCAEDAMVRDGRILLRRDWIKTKIFILDVHAPSNMVRILIICVYIYIIHIL